VTIKIAPAPTFEAAAQRIVKSWRDVSSRKLIRIEGFDGVGKSGLVQIVKENIVAEHVEGDKFVDKSGKPIPYSKCIRQIEFDRALERAIETGRVVILDAVCLDEVAPTNKWGRGFVVYVKRLSFNNPDPIWHEGLNLEAETPSDEVRRSIHLYHKRVKPHETADLVIELPEKCHSMTQGKFSRDLCFDPVGSEVIWSE